MSGVGGKMVRAEGIGEESQSTSMDLGRPGAESTQERSGDQAPKELKASRHKWKVSETVSKCPSHTLYELNGFVALPGF